MGTIKNYEDSEVQPTVSLVTTSPENSTLQVQSDPHFQPQTPVHNSNETVDKHIRFGSYISLQHNTTLRYLSSRSSSNETNETSTNGNKDQVCLSENKI